MVFNIYEDTKSFIHKINPKIKILSLFFLSPVLVFIENLKLYFVILFFISSLYAFSRIPFMSIIDKIKGLLYFVIFIFLIKIFNNSFLESALVSLRLLNLILFTTLITLTTRTSEFIKFIEELLTFIKISKKNSDKILLSITLSINLIHHLKKIYQEVSLAQKSRGNDRSIFALATPLILRTLKSCDEISQAIDSRS